MGPGLVTSENNGLAKDYAIYELCLGNMFRLSIIGGASSVSKGHPKVTSPGFKVSGHFIFVKRVFICFFG